MVIFAECPQCRTQITINAKQDVKLVVNKNKTRMMMNCSVCNSEFEVLVKLKVRKPKEAKARILDALDPKEGKKTKLKSAKGIPNEL